MARRFAPVKIVADAALTRVEALFARWGELRIRPGREIGPRDVADADILLVRSTTRVDEHLLGGSRVRFVGTATSGVDHIDRDFLAARGIAFASAPGCNARAVVEYVLSALCACRPGWRRQTVGILGCGQVGRRLYLCLRGLGVRCRVYDPLLPAGQVADQMPLAAVLQADILCLHTPLTISGQYPTWHLIDAAALASLRPGALLINAGRGAVIDHAALLRHLQSGADLQVALDVWESEPAIDEELLRRVTLGTPHIAGHSREGRERGSLMLLTALRQWLGATAAPPDGYRAAEPPRVIAAAARFEDSLLAVYDVRMVHARLLADLARARGEPTQARRTPAVEADTARVAFDRIRRWAAQRREFSAYRIAGADPAQARALTRVGLALVGEGPE